MTSLKLEIVEKNPTQVWKSTWNTAAYKPNVANIQYISEKAKRGIKSQLQLKNEGKSDNLQTHLTHLIRCCPFFYFFFFLNISTK